MEKKKRSFDCYFCNKRIQDDNEMGHTSVCGNVLVPCPNKCGSYIPRMELSKHKEECVNRVGKATRLTNPNNKTNSGSTSDFSSNNSASGTLKSNSGSTMLDKPAKSNNLDLFLKIQDDFKKLSTKVSTIEHRNHDLSQNLQIKQDRELDRIKYQNRSFQEWREIIDLQIESLKQSSLSCERFRSERDSFWMSLQQKFLNLERFQFELSSLKESTLKEHNYNRKVKEEFAAKLDEFQDLYKEENAAIAALWNDEKVLTDNIRKDINAIHKILEEHKAKFTSLVFDVKTISQIASEAADRVEIVERDFNDVSKQVEKMKSDMDILELLVSTGNPPSSRPGHLLWKISEFQLKFKSAKDNNASVLKSEKFYTHEFGYKIRILMYLNGLKKWKDRYVLISIHVLQGEYDALLKWPCRIEGTATLRDQENLDNATNFSKYITAKRQCGGEETEEPQESSSSYIFIPHSTLTKSKYLKDDTIFLEIQFSNKKGNTETDL